MKNYQQALSKCHKKAWQEIKAIRTAPDMNCVEGLISNALYKTFGLWNLGLLKIGMRKLGQMGEFESMVRIHRANWDRHMSEVRYYLIEQINPRLHKSRMYMKLTGMIE